MKKMILAVGAIVAAFATGARAAEETYEGTATLTNNQSFDGPYGLLPLGSTLDLIISINAPNGITSDTTLNAIGYGVTPLDSFSASIGNYQFGTPSDGGGYFVTSELQFYGNQYTGFSDNDGAGNVSFTLFNFSIDTPTGVNAYDSSGLPLFQLATSGTAQITTYDGAFLSFDLNVSSFHPVPEIDPTFAASSITLILGGLLVLRGRRPWQRLSA